MTTTRQIKNINLFINSFLVRCSSDDILEIWNNKDTQSNFIKIFKNNFSKKTPNKPKKGKNSYIFFCSANREIVKENLDKGAKGKEVMTELVRLWYELKNSTNESDKKKMKKYTEEAKKDNDRYKEEIENYLQSAEKKIEDKPVIIKKKTYGYINFSKEYRKGVKENNPEKTGNEITYILSSLWKNFNEDEKVGWN